MPYGLPFLGFLNQQQSAPAEDETVVRPQLDPRRGPFTFPRQSSFPFFGLDVEGGGGQASEVPLGPIPEVGTSLPDRLSFTPQDFGVGGGGPPVTMFNPEAIPAPPERRVDPALEGRAEYQRGREERLNALFDRFEQQMLRNDPSDDPWWQRLGGALGAIAARDSLAEAGVATGEYFASEEQRRMAIQQALMDLGLGREELAGDLSEAELAALSGTFQAEEGTRRDAYGVDVANVGQRNSASQSNIERSDRAAAAGWQADQAIALSEFERNQNQLDAAILEAARNGDIQAYGSLFGVLPESMQGEAIERAAQQGLESIITESGNPQQAHRRLEEIVGRALPRPPRNLRNATARQLAQWYAANGVPLNHPAIRDAFPGFGATDSAE